MNPSEPVFVYFEDDPPSRTIVEVLLTRVMNYQHVIMFEDSHDVIAKLEAIDMIPTVFFIDILLFGFVKPHDLFCKVDQALPQCVWLQYFHSTTQP